MYYKYLSRLFFAFIAVFGPTSALCMESNNQTADQSNQQQTIVVTATRFETSIATAPVNTTVISSQDISSSAAANLSQVLENLGGIYVKDLFGESDSKSSVDMGGFGATGSLNTLILLNGRRLNDADLAGVNLSAIPLNAIEKIEVVHGNASVLYGDNATSGVINIVTKTGFDKKAGNAQLDHGSYNNQGAHLFYSDSQHNTAAIFALNSLTSDGYRENSAIDSKNAMADFSISGDDSIYGFRANLSSEHLELPGSLPEYTYIHDRTASNTSIEFIDEDRNTEEFYIQQGNFAAEIGYRERNQSSYIFGDVISNLNTVSATPRYAINISKHKLIAGADLYTSTLDVNADFASYYNKNNTTRNSVAAYVTDDISMGDNISVNLGIRKQRVNVNIANNDILSAIKTKQKQSDSLSAWDFTVNKKFSPLYKGYLRYASGMRFPVLDEMWDYFFGVINILEPQTSRHTEAGLQVILPDHGNLDITVFHINLKNEIAFDAATYSNLNLDPTEHNGIDVSYRTAFSPFWRINTNLNWRRATFSKGPNKSNEIPEIPRIHASISQQFQIRTHQQLGIDLVYTGERRFGDDFANVGKTMGGYSTANAKYQLQISNWSYALTINNLTNKKAADLGQYYDFAPNPYFYYPLPERSFLISVSTNI